MSETALHVLAISEVLRMIFCNLERRWLVCCALVCKGWSEVALDVLWYKVEGVLQLAAALAPVGKPYNSISDYEYLGRPGDCELLRRWSRFESMYCNRVHVFHVNKYFYALLRPLSQIRPPRPLLPKLRTFIYDGCVDLNCVDVLVTFLHEGVERCTLSDRITLREKLTVPGFSALCHFIEVRTPFLTHLVLNFSPNPEFVEFVAHLFRTGLSRVIAVELPAFRDISTILSAARYHPKIQNLTFGRYELRRNQPSLAVAVVGPPDSSDVSFLHLEQISFNTAKYKALCDFFVGSFRKLRFVNILTCTVESPSAIRMIVSKMSQSCPNICSLKVSFVDALSKHVPNLASLEDILHLEDIMPVLQCPNITHFDFQHPYPFDITDSGIQAIALAWPKLTYIRLCPTPVYGCDDISVVSKPSVGAFAILFEHCPLIEEIHLLIDANASFTLSSSPVQPKNIRVVGVGRSSISDQHEVALNFNQFCPPHVKLSFDVAWFANTHNEAVSNKWGDVRRLLPLMNELKARFIVSADRHKGDSMEEV
ncbi:hypothetical protein VKT23_004912 [Stygiomarasmius scandens]|uniref:F-box domain-containing protein n=1 Tax=Marasmiellus scandens TaxID=2682957 RepID=A0ABR1JU67_9AGAR